MAWTENEIEWKEKKKHVEVADKIIVNTTNDSKAVVEIKNDIPEESPKKENIETKPTVEKINDKINSKDIAREMEIIKPPIQHQTKNIVRHKDMNPEQLKIYKREAAKKTYAKYGGIKNYLAMLKMRKQKK